MLYAGTYFLVGRRTLFHEIPNLPSVEANLGGTIKPIVAILVINVYQDYVQVPSLEYEY